MKTITLDTLTLDGASIWVDEEKGTLRLEVLYTVSSADGSVAIQRRREVQDLLSDSERKAILAMTARMKAALAAEEL